MNTIYKEILLDHYKNPRNKGTISNPHFSSRKHIPSCGDSISLAGIFQDEKIQEIRFEGSGCVISQATASLLSQAMQGKTVHEVLAFSAEDVLKLIGMQLGPLRIQCALLSLQALQEAIRAYQGGWYAASR